jgi:hypothetical protein
VQLVQVQVQGVPQAEQALVQALEAKLEAIQWVHLLQMRAKVQVLVFLILQVLVFLVPMPQVGKLLPPLPQ